MRAVAITDIRMRAVAIMGIRMRAGRRFVWPGELLCHYAVPPRYLQVMAAGAHHGGCSHAGAVVRKGVS